MSLIFACLLVTVVDGDTFRCPQVETERPSLRADLAAVNHKVRLARIDTAERGEPGFERAKASLAALIGGRKVICTLVDADPRTPGFQRRDRFGRPVARCSAGGVDLGQAQLDAGLAVVWPPRR
jgi:micrococcal nuclease